MTRITVEPAHPAGDSAEAFTDLMRDAWDGIPDEEVIPPHVFTAAGETGNLLAAHSDGELVGFCYQMPDTTRDATLYSHAVGVAEAYQGRGVWERLKWAQREHALARGFETIRWTYDPLLGGNAKLNVRKLGATVSEYETALYDTDNYASSGETPDDRFVVSWELQRDRVVRRAAAASASTVDQSTRSDTTSDSPSTPDGPPDDEPVVLLSARGPELAVAESPAVERVGDDSEFAFTLDSVESETVTVQVPQDREETETVDTEHDWRYATRETFTALFERGYTVTDFRVDPDDHNSYVLEAER